MDSRDQTHIVLMLGILQMQFAAKACAKYYKKEELNVRQDFELEMFGVGGNTTAHNILNSASSQAQLSES